MRRVVITGQGIVSSLGNNLAHVAHSLREGRSGIRINPTYAERGMRCQVSGRPDLVLEQVVDRRTLRFMGDAAAYAWLSMKQAAEQAGLEPAQMSDPRTGFVMTNPCAGRSLATGADDASAMKAPPCGKRLF